MALIERITEIAHHRNGVDGAPFYVLRFKCNKDETTEHGNDFLGIVFEKSHHVAVISLAEISHVGVVFGLNSFRGDNFEPELRQAIKDFEGE